MSNPVRGHIFWVYVAIAAVLFAWIGVRTQMTADRQEREAQTAVLFADHTRQCLHELIDTLAARAQINQESDRLNNEQHKALVGLITAVHEARTEAAYSQVLSDFLPQVVEAQRNQESLLTARAEHPLPSPDCPVVTAR